MSYFHITLKQGRSDSMILESPSKLAILSFFNSVSTAIVSGIKKIVYSKDLKINYVPSTPTNEAYYKEVLVFAKSKTKSKVFRLYFVKESITKDKILNQFKKLNIDDEKIIDIYNVQLIS